MSRRWGIVLGLFLVCIAGGVNGFADALWARMLAGAFFVFGAHVHAGYSYGPLGKGK